MSAEDASSREARPGRTAESEPAEAHLGGADGPTAASAIEVLLDWALEASVEAERIDEAHAVVVLPGEKKLRTTVSVRAVRDRIDLQAFVVRHPDENHARFHAWLLRTNLGLRGPAFSIDADGDVYLGGSVPARAWDAACVDDWMGRMLSVADSSFNELLVLGFLTSMKKEWAWRVARGESTRNLAAFEHLLTRDNEFLGTYSSEDNPS